MNCHGYSPEKKASDLINPYYKRGCCQLERSTHKAVFFVSLAFSDCRTNPSCWSACKPLGYGAWIGSFITLEIVINVVNQLIPTLHIRCGCAWFISFPNVPWSIEGDGHPLINRGQHNQHKDSNSGMDDPLIPCKLSVAYILPTKLLVLYLLYPPSAFFDHSENMVSQRHKVVYLP